MNGIAQMQGGKNWILPVKRLMQTCYSETLIGWQSGKKTLMSLYGTEWREHDNRLRPDESAFLYWLSCFKGAELQAEIPHGPTLEIFIFCDFVQCVHTDQWEWLSNERRKSTYVIDLLRQICRSVLKLDITPYGIMESLSEFGLAYYFAVVGISFTVPPNQQTQSLS